MLPSRRRRPVSETVQRWFCTYSPMPAASRSGRKMTQLPEPQAYRLNAQSPSPTPVRASKEKVAPEFSSRSVTRGEDASAS